jgi:hypothetical protein
MAPLLAAFAVDHADEERGEELATRVMLGEGRRPHRLVGNRQMDQGRWEAQRTLVHHALLSIGMHQKEGMAQA